MGADTQKTRRTYFTHPLVDESLKCLPAALDHQDPKSFRQYVVDHVPQNSLKGRQRIGRDMLQRFAPNGKLNLPLAAAVAQFGNSRASREILFFELLNVYPMLQEIAIHWVAELAPEGASRASLREFLESKIPGRSTEKVAKDAITTMYQCGKVARPKVGWYRAVWAAPPVEVFLYALTRLCPDATMVRVDLFSGMPIHRAMLWPSSSIEDLLREAERAGHVSRISRLDQYHQFTLAGSGRERLKLLLPNLPDVSAQPSLFAGAEEEGQ
jgi:hypothetical protein